MDAEAGKIGSIDGLFRVFFNNNNYNYNLVSLVDIDC